jgi:hypothetical protein
MLIAEVSGGYPDGTGVALAGATFFAFTFLSLAGLAKLSSFFSGVAVACPGAGVSGQGEVDVLGICDEGEAECMNIAEYSLSVVV